MEVNYENIIIIINHESDKEFIYFIEICVYLRENVST